MMISLILAKFSVEVVGSEKGIQPGAGQGAIDRTMGDAMVLILGTKQRMTIEGSGIVWLLVGDENQRAGGGGGAFESERIEDITESSRDAAWLRLPVGIKVAGTLSLQRCHGS